MSRFAPVQAKKPFAWSYSRLKNFESCPLRHQQIDLLKAVKEEEGEALLWGNELHAAMAKAVNGTPLPPAFRAYQKWIDDITGGGDAEVHAELKLAMREDFSPCEFFAKDAWFRGVIDVIKIMGEVALVADYKTGKVLEDSVQLGLFAQLAFSHFPALQAVRTEFIWIKADCTSREDFTRADMPDLWKALGPRVQSLRNAWETGEYPPRPSGLCKRFCPVSTCDHHGR